MKKYFMTGTDDELQFGDMIELDFTRENEKGNTVHHHMDVKFIPELVDMLLENEVIEVEDDEEEEEEEFECPMEKLDELIDYFEECIKGFEDGLKRVDNLEKAVAQLQGNKHPEPKKVIKKNAKEAGK